ncbi:alpha/beta fold hydrolase [Candidatus Poriferisodalis sp.]|uniref:alpha/beta fold hydrolase n=1 Tax=Candidatus Poriferisodalis sp. TaxID=3101277 RepID=UPI003AF65DDE
MLRLTTSDGEHAVLHDLGGHGVPLLMTHGNGLNAGMWATVVPHLRDTFHCWGLDFRGHGASRPQHDAMSVKRPRFVDEVLAAVNALGGEPMLAVGHSLGAASLLLAELRQPGTYRGLYLYEPVLVSEGFPMPDSDHELVVASRRRRIRFATVDEAYERFVSKPPFSRCEPEAVRAYVEIGTYPSGDDAVRLSCSGDTEARIYEAGVPIDYSDFATVTCPTVVARGDSVAQWNQIPPQVAQPIAEALGNGRLEAFAELSHFGPMEDGERVAEAIRAHLEPLVAA